MKIYVFRILIISLLMGLQACVGVQTFPGAARAGDTITLALGSSDNMTKTNTSLQFVHNDTTIVPVDLPIRSVIRLRPDNTSNAALFDELVESSEVNSGHSAWLTAVVVDLPSDIPVGNGVINITTSTRTPGSNINITPVSLEVLPGTGSSYTFTYDFFGNSRPGSLSSLEALQQIVVKPTLISGRKGYGAAEIKINAPIRRLLDSAVTVPDADIRVIQDDKYIQNSKSQVYMTWTRTGDIITVRFVSPLASMTYSQTRFSVMLRSVGIDNQFITSPAPSLSSVKFYDLNGNIVTDVSTPTLTDYSVAIE